MSQPLLQVFGVASMMLIAIGSSLFLADGDHFTPVDVPGAILTVAFGINNLGQIVGAFRDSDGVHGFILDQGVFSTVDFPTNLPTYTELRGINDRGQIVGDTPNNPGGTRFAFVLDNGVFTHLDAPFPISPRGINSRGEIVGSYQGGGNIGRSDIT
jgi:probable HAF family extracellular repeat protein